MNEFYYNVLAEIKSDKYRSCGFYKMNKILKN